MGKGSKKITNLRKVGKPYDIRVVGEGSENTSLPLLHTWKKRKSEKIFRKKKEKIFRKYVVNRFGQIHYPALEPL